MLADRWTENNMSGWHLGIIGGSGLYALDILEHPAWVTVESPWGAPSDAVLNGKVGGVKLAFLPRHGRGHRIAPHQINARANIDVLKRLGCTDVLAISAVGSLDARFAPGDFVAVDQFIDRSKNGASTFFEDGIVAHVPMADPVCPRLSDLAAAAARAAGATVHTPATYLSIEGPQFSTRAESRMYQSWGAGVIGMTAMPEERLAREAELPYALLAMVTDYDCWHEDGDVDIADVLRVMAANAGVARNTIIKLVKSLPKERPASPLDTVLDTAIITPHDAWEPAALARLDAVMARVVPLTAGK
jgi:5'-methylthioadenosine phosphorylase